MDLIEPTFFSVLIFVLVSASNRTNNDLEKRSIQKRNLEFWVPHQYEPGQEIKQENT